jgi:hypothetical protein
LFFAVVVPPTVYTLRYIVVVFDKLKILTGCSAIVWLEPGATETAPSEAYVKY